MHRDIPLLNNWITSGSEAQMQKAVSTLSIKMVYHLIPHMIQITDLTVIVCSLFLSFFPVDPFPFAPPKPFIKNNFWKEK